MNAQGYAYLDRYAKLQPFSNFLAYHANFSLTPIELRRKRVLSFLLKKIKKYIYSAENDRELFQVCLSILNYLILSYNPETHKVENSLMQLLEDLTFLVRDGSEQIRTQFYNHLTSLSKRKQKYSNAFFYIQRIVGLMTVNNQNQLASDFLMNQYTSSSDHMNNIRFTFLLNTFNANTNSFQLKPYKEKVLKDPQTTTDAVLDLANRVQSQESIDDALSVLKAYKNPDFKGADSFLIKKKYFEVAYENGEQLEKEEIVELLQADLFDIEYIHRVLSYTEFFLTDDASLKPFMKQLIMKVLKFNYGNSLLWAKLRRLFIVSNETDLIDEDMENEQNNNNVEGDEENRGERKSEVQQKLSFDTSEIQLLSKIHFSGKYMRQDFKAVKQQKNNKEAKLLIQHKKAVLILLVQSISDSDENQDEQSMKILSKYSNQYLEIEKDLLIDQVEEEQSNEGIEEEEESN